MSKFLILYNATTPASKVMADTTPEEQQAAMNDWIVWKDSLPKTLGFEFGMPLEVLGRLTAQGATDSDNSASGYSIMESDSKETVLEALMTHPHLQRTGSAIDVLEMLAMAGM